MTLRILLEDKSLTLSERFWAVATIVAVGRNVGTTEAPDMLTFVCVASASNDCPSEMLEGTAISGVSTLDATVNTEVVFAMPLKSAVQDVRIAEVRTSPLRLIALGKGCCKICDGVDRKDAECFSTQERNVTPSSVSSPDDGSSVGRNCPLLLLCTCTTCLATELFQDWVCIIMIVARVGRR